MEAGPVRLHGTTAIIGTKNIAKHLQTLQNRVK
jgi:hypothetical protein